MKVITLVTIFILKIGFIHANLPEWKLASKTCCEQVYNDKVSRDKCVSELEIAMKDSFIEYNLKVHLKKKEIQARNYQILTLNSLPINKEKYEGLTSPEEKATVTKKIVDENKEKIVMVVKEARKKALEEFTRKLKSMCLVISKEIAKQGDANTFTIEVFALIVSSETRQFRNENCAEFIKYLKENKEDLEKLKVRGADLWQRLYFMDKQVVNVIKHCNCKEILLSEGFHKFIKWLFHQPKEVKLCSLTKTVEVYKEHKKIIDEDLENNKATIVEEMKDCN